MKRLIWVLLLAGYFPFTLLAATYQSQALFELVHFAETGNNLVVELEKIQRALTDGADPNWIDSTNRQHVSVLNNYVTRIGFSNDRAIQDQGVTAINLLFKHGAKLQYCDGSILYFPISAGQYELVKILLEKGASATFWPKAEIGSDITPIEHATAQGDVRIIDLLVNYGATRLNSYDAIQVRFIELAKTGSVEELRNLVKMKARVNSPNRQGQTALSNALSPLLYGYDAYIKIMYLLNLGADVNLKANSIIPRGTTTPLHQVIYVSSFSYKANRDTSYAEQLLRELLKRGAYVSATDDEGRNPVAAFHHDAIIDLQLSYYRS